MLNKTKIDDPSFTVESVLEKNLEDLTLFLGSNEKAKSTLYDEIIEMVERSLIKIALRRSNNVKTSAAAFLGINRNTLHKKIEQLNISCKDK
jgi:two-component system nitrogen regulation response regulator GlnG